MSSIKDRQIFSFKEFQLDYLLLGKGERLLICFPGFGRPAEDFIFFEPVLRQKYTMCCVNHFFHFNSTAHSRDPHRKPLSLNELKLVLEMLCQHLGYKRFSLLGYSLGGRICLTVAQLLPRKLDALFLFAPDGITRSRWYMFTTHTLAGQWLYRRFMNKNEFFFAMLKKLRDWKLITGKMHDFVRNNTATPERQKLVYLVWLFLRRIEPDLVQLGRVLSQQKPLIRAYFGKYDKILRPENGEKLKKHLPWAEVRYLNAGHRLLTTATSAVLAEDVRKLDV